MIAVILRRSAESEPIASWTVQDWVGDPDALQALADEAGCVVTVVPLARVQPLDPAELVRRARARLLDEDTDLSRIVTYRPGGPPPGELEDLPL